MKTTSAVIAAVVVALVVAPWGGDGLLGMTLGGAAVLALFAGIALWIRRTMSHH